MMAREQEMLSVMGRIQIRETNDLQIVTSGLQRTAGPYKVPLADGPTFLGARPFIPNSGVLPAPMSALWQFQPRATLSPARAVEYERFAPGSHR